VIATHRQLEQLRKIAAPLMRHQERHDDMPRHAALTAERIA
jgi:hypothetical protein